MKRDMDFVRQILLDIENGKRSFQIAEDDDPSDADYGSSISDHDKVNHHIIIMRDEGLIRVISNGYTYVQVSGLTWEGHDFIDTLRDPALWKKTKSAASTVGGVGFKALMEIGKAIAKQELQKLGIPLP